MVEWTKNQAESCFLDDLYEKAQGLSNLLGPAATSRNQFEAMLSLSYNTGLANLAKSTLLKAHLAGDFDKAASEFLKWNKAHVKGKLVVLNGLTKRRKAESYLYRHLTSSLAVEV
jgi:lysozyme